MSPQPSHAGSDTACRPAVPVSDRGRERTDHDLVQRLRRGDNSAFAEIVCDWSPMMRRVARAHVSTDASADEIVQDTWLAVVHGLADFEGRSSLRTWAFHILTNRAKTCGIREARSIPWSSVGPSGTDSPVVDPDRFRRPDDGHQQHWSDLGAPQPRWEPSPEGAALSGEIRSHLADALSLLPERQKAVLTLRDVHGLTAQEVCEHLVITAANQRVLLHRARARLRERLADFYHPARA